MDTLDLQKLGHGGRKGNKGGAGVKDHTSVVHLGSRIPEGDGIQIDFPVGLAPQRDLDELTSVVILVDTTENGLGFLLVIGVTKIEGKYRFVQKTLVEHIVKWGNNAVDTDGVVTQTHDSIEATKGKGKAGLRSGLGEVLLLDLQITNLESVLRDETFKRTGSVTNGEIGSVLLVCGRRGRVILGVEVAGNRAAL